MPEIDEVRQKFEPKGVRFLALSLDPDPDLARRASARLNFQMPVAVAQGEVLGPLGIRQVPSTVYIDSRGVIAAAASGARGKRFVEARASDLLK